MKSNYKIIWSLHAKDSIDKIFEYIKAESPQNAHKVKRKIIELVNTLTFFPEKHTREQLLDREKGNFRFVPIWNYKIIYEIAENEIIVLDIFHSAQNPNKIENPTKIEL